MTDPFHSRNTRLTIVNYLDSCLMEKAELEQFAVDDGPITILCTNPDTIKSTGTLYGNCMKSQPAVRATSYSRLYRST